MMINIRSAMLKLLKVFNDAVAAQHSFRLYYVCKGEILSQMPFEKYQWISAVWSSYENSEIYSNSDGVENLNNIIISTEFLEVIYLTNIDILEKIGDLHGGFFTKGRLSIDNLDGYIDVVSWFNNNQNSPENLFSVISYIKGKVDQEKAQEKAKNLEEAKDDDSDDRVSDDRVDTRFIWRGGNIYYENEIGDYYSIKDIMYWSYMHGTVQAIRDGRPEPVGNWYQFPFHDDHAKRWLGRGFEGLGICKNLNYCGNSDYAQVTTAYKQYLFEFLGYEELIRIRKTFDKPLIRGPLFERLDGEVPHEGQAYIEGEPANQPWKGFFSISKIGKGVSIIHTTTDWLKVYKDYKDHEEISKSNLLNAGISSTYTVLLVSGNTAYLPHLPAAKATIQIYKGDYEGAAATTLFALGIYATNCILFNYTPKTALVVSTLLLLSSGAYGVYELGHLVYNLFIADNTANEVMNDYIHVCQEYIPNGTMSFKPVCGTFIEGLNETSLEFQMGRFEVFNGTVEV
ncbi:hypothetical protein Cyrtocomes_00921 [Candidatus Cyrtobacter comes]|uniref:Uncharacterized protein n=1 Tax=Candidatus Cyrtobacter comes TaxID=675776 RepID=A0ABU5L9M0_9RICK|nr:hypothetical protein [Candidatus Cyrtobacter comes]MDZ5762534.1 hypothetical protein [Candidatus Cyrtobacter comes]